MPLFNPDDGLPLLAARSWYSLMDGARSPTDLARFTAEAGWGSLALADVNNFYALPELVDAAADAGIKAVAAASVETNGVAFRAYCLDRQGFARLGLLLTRVLAVEVPRRRSRLPPEALRAEDPSAEDLLAQREGRPEAAPAGLDAGPEAAPARPEAGGGAYDPIAEFAAEGWEGLALTSADPTVLRALAGKGRLFAALSPGAPQLATARLARELGLPPIAEHPARFAKPEDGGTWRLARAIEERRSLPALERAGIQEPPGALLLKERRARELLSAFPEALENARAVAEGAAPALSFFADPPVFPAYRGLPEEESFRILRSSCAEGIPRRYGGAPPAALNARLERELRIIRDKGFAAYFLVVRDIVSRCPRTCGRGSAASSLVSYLLGLTHVDPLEHDLFFERFLNEGRRDPPDIDIDFPWDERPAVLASVFSEYSGRAAMVADHCGFSDRGSLRESALAFGMGDEELRRAGRSLRLGRLDELPPALIGMARAIKGMPRYIGTHPGGVVITPRPISDYAHVQASPAGLPVLAWEKEGTERAGLVKIDLLGNRSLAVLRDCLELVNAARATAPSEPAAPSQAAPPEGATAKSLAWDFRGADSDPAARALVESGRSMGVFYIESPATRQLLLKMGTVDYRRLVAASSIIRPAANKWIDEYVRRLRGGRWRRLPEGLETALAETYGIMVYQEDVSRVAMAVAGFGAVEADGLRKALTKKRKGGALEDFRGRFLAGCAARRVSGADAAEMWDMMLSFDGYSFCKAHSASYALVSYRLAWMKAHYPAIFMASVINNGGGFYGVQAYVGEARRLGIGILPPHVNASACGYAVVPTAVEGPQAVETSAGEAPAAGDDSPQALRVGLAQVASLSRASIERILEARKKGGPFLSLEDFLDRVRPKNAAAEGGRALGCPVRGRSAVGRSAEGGRALVRSARATGGISFDELRALVRSGSLDALPAFAAGPALGRTQALWALHRLRSQAASEGPPGPRLIEDSWSPPAFVVDYGESARLADEMRFLGILVARRPAELYSSRAVLTAMRKGLPPPSAASELPGLEGSRVSVAGTKIAAKQVLSKDGREMAFMTLEDGDGLVEVVLFPQAYERALPILEENSAILVVGTARSDYGAVSVHAEEAYGLNRPEQDGAP